MKVLTPEDVAEYKRRVEALRAIMREHDLDAVIIGSDDIGASTGSGTSMEPQGPPRYARWISGFYVNTLGTKDVVVVVPLSGEPTLIVPAGQLGCTRLLAERVSWIDRVVSSYRAGDIATLYGLRDDSSSAVAEVIREYGLESARIGVVNNWRNSQKTRSLLPNARFEPTTIVPPAGEYRDWLKPLIRTCSPWEIKRMEMIQAPAESAMRAFKEAAVDGATHREAIAAATYQAVLHGAETAKFIINVGEDYFGLAFWPDDVPSARFHTGDLIVDQTEITLDGYRLQYARSWVLGEPNDAQRLVLDTAQRALEAMIERTVIGATGGEIYEAGAAVIARAGLYPWSTLGHPDGWQHSVLLAETLAGEEIALMPKNTGRVVDGKLLTIHGNAYDPKSGYACIISDPIVIEGGRRRLLFH